MKSFDIVIASLPFIETSEPLMAPGLLKGVVNKTGLTCSTFDFNAEIISQMSAMSNEQNTKLTRWFLYREYNDCAETQQQVKKLVEYVADRIVSKNPKWICLSLFCRTAKDFSVNLCKHLRTLTSAKIVIGGNAVFTDEKSPRPWAKVLLKAKYIDYYIVGDGEEPLYNLLTVGSLEGVNVEQFQILEDLSTQPFSDYTDYDWDLYPVKRIPMYGSRGCVRRCTFCDVYKIWKKFKLRSADDVFNEMLFQIEQTGIRSFYFRDSLINGSVSEYKKLIRLMAEYNQSHDINERITWASFFIFRPKNQMDEEDWKLTAESGAVDLIVGIESLVDHIRFHMRKKFTNDDIDFGLEMAKKYRIGLTFLLIIGYVNETEQDFEDSLTWLREHQQYAGFPIHSVSAGGTLTVTDLTDLYQNAQDFDITIGDNIYLWENKKINLDYATRERRKEIFIETAISLGYPIFSHEKPVT